MDAGSFPERPREQSRSVRCCIVGGGPAGMMLGYLLGRAGVETLVLEKHADFLRDFRGDTVHPSTLQIMDELGLLDEFLKRPHQEVRRLQGRFGKVTLQVADLERLAIKSRFIALMPQWDFLNFLLEQGARFPSLRVLRNAEVIDLIRDGDAVNGVIARTRDGLLTVDADLTVGCDGRHSIVRERGGLEVEDVGAPIDVLWFRVGKDKDTTGQTLLHLEQGRMLVTLDRGDYWQCAYVIPKGNTDAVKAGGLPAFRKTIVEMLPALHDHIGEVKDWDDVKLLTVTIDRLKQWSRPGLLCIGDAAHAMSPVGGVGINLAIQDAVATANLLAEKLQQGRPNADDLGAVSARRAFPAKVVQAMQVQVQNRIISPNLRGGTLKVPIVLRLIDAVPWLQGLTARFVGIGVRPEHVRSPEAPQGAFFGRAESGLS
jgi:2-polyprenyl-6-methoxyphenol hydroxylase-like FAD-dependent oxidoreductase